MPTMSLISARRSCDPGRGTGRSSQEPSGAYDVHVYVETGIEVEIGSRSPRYRRRASKLSAQLADSSTP